MGLRPINTQHQIRKNVAQNNEQHKSTPNIPTKTAQRDFSTSTQFNWAVIKTSHKTKIWKQNIMKNTRMLRVIWRNGLRATGIFLVIEVLCLVSVLRYFKRTADNIKDNMKLCRFFNLSPRSLWFVIWDIFFDKMNYKMNSQTCLRPPCE